MEQLLNYVFSSDSLGELLRKQSDSNLWLKKVEDILQNNKYTKGRLLLTVGQIPDQIFFLKKGSVRAYYYDADGNERTFYLWDDYSIVTDIVNYTKKQPSDLFIEVCEEANVLVIPRTPLDEIIHEFPGSILFLYGIQSQYTEHHRERDKESQTMTAIEKALIL